MSTPFSTHLSNKTLLCFALILLSTQAAILSQYNTPPPSYPSDPRDYTDDAETFVQTLQLIISSMTQTLNPLITSYYIHSQYISNQTLTNLTIFMYNDTLTPAQSNLLWSDPQYGWSSPYSLIPWVKLALSYSQDYLHHPAIDPMYIVLKAHFGLTDAQMISLTFAANPGTTLPSSMLYLLSLEAQSTIAQAFLCISAIGCQDIELVALQFYQANLTKLPPFTAVPPLSSIVELNSTYPAPPELATADAANVEFEMVLAISLISTDNNNNRNLLELQVAQFILQYQNNTQAIMDYLSLDNTQQAQVLVDYVNYILTQYTYQGEQAITQHNANVITGGINNLTATIANLTINVTAIGTFNLMISQNKSCDILLQDCQADAILVENICDNPNFTLNTAQGQAAWVTAFYQVQVQDYTMSNIIETVTGINAGQITTLLSNTSQFGTIVQTVINAISTQFGCPQTPCDGDYLSMLQWSGSNFTLELPQEYFSQTYESLADIFPEYFGGFVPEFPVFAQRNLALNVELSEDQGVALLGYGVGSVNNNYEVFRLLSMAQQSDFKGIQSRFGLNQVAANALLSYFYSGFIN